MNFCVHSPRTGMTEASARRKKSHDLSAGYVHVHFFVMYMIVQKNVLDYLLFKNTKMYNHIHCSECSLCRVHAAMESNKSSG